MDGASDAVHEHAFLCSDVEDGEIDDEEYQVPEAMDVDHQNTTEPPVLVNSAKYEPSSEQIEILEDSRGNVENVDNVNCELQKASAMIDCAEGQTSVAAPEAGKKTKRRRPKKRKSRNVAQFVRETSERLQEKKISLVWALVQRLGMDAVQSLVNEVDVIEKCGGQMTIDNKRRRTPGGVLWNILKGRVQPQVYKEIMSQGNEVLKQKAKEAKETLKRQRMDVDEPAGKSKRRRLLENDLGTSMLGTHSKQGTWPTSRCKVPKDLSTLTDGPVRDDCGPATSKVQMAWQEGVKKRDVSDESDPKAPFTGSSVLGLGADTANGQKKATRITDRLRIPVEYSDL